MCLFCRTWISDATYHNASVTQLHNILVVWHNEQAQKRRLAVGAISSWGFPFHWVAPNRHLNGLQMTKTHPSTKATDLLLSICNFKIHPALLLKRFWFSRLKIIRGKPVKLNSWKTQSEVETPTTALSMAKNRWERSWQQTSYLSTQHAKMCLLLRKFLH